ncbi:Holliday junction branch migration protein RuvA [Natronincola ferrireducens]|uniref:Holliday junction branch migration complex subunit RuvA n=1 Tax=Natronincola ferrireducens TaxID=393762 RepID=A0A1G9CYA8_9FIRM|nr:Holliday junction branch migration protein RuvA [Natronincola ferrireducens]SDK56676.1 Holliday junction DNA helicase subunit RuvA [Natronincola ferrireducens]
MYEYIKGTVSDVLLDKIIIEVGGIGYRIHSSLNSGSSIQKGDTVTIFTYLVVKEDEMSLYGFTTKDELHMFQQLISVSKVGPKAAVSILSTHTPKKLATHILAKDINSISKAPGIGKKTAERIIVELKDKVSQYSLVMEKEDMSIDMASHYEVVEALGALGYSKQEVEKVLHSMKDKNLSTEDMIKQALKLLMR